MNPILAVSRLDTGALFGIIVLGVIAVIGILAQVDEAARRQVREEEAAEAAKKRKLESEQREIEKARRKKEEEAETDRRKESHRERMRPTLQAAVAHGRDVCWDHSTIDPRYCPVCHTCLCRTPGEDYHGECWMKKFR